MGNFGVVMKVLIFISFSLHLSSAVKHCVQYFYTGVTPGIHFPEFTVVGQVDGEQIVYYDSNIRKSIPRTEWIKKNEGEDYWIRETQNLQGDQENFKVNMETLMNRFNQTTGVHTVQNIYGCELDDDGTVRGYNQFGYDGEDFLIFDVKTLSWIAATPQAVITKNKWDSDTGYNKVRENYLKNECIDWLKKYVSYGRETLERKVRPEASVFHRSSSELVCHATGFFPKLISVTWQKDGEDVYEDVEMRETLPNQDGTYQKRSILTVSAEDLKKHEYTCVIQHSSLEKKGVVKSLPDGRSGGVLIGIIAGVLAVVVLVVVVVVFVIWKKKKNSDFNPVPARPSSTNSIQSNDSDESTDSKQSTDSSGHLLKRE